MPTSNIKSQCVHELAKALPPRTGQLITSAVEVALEKRPAATTFPGPTY